MSNISQSAPDGASADVALLPGDAVTSPDSPARASGESADLTKTGLRLRRKRFAIMAASLAVAAALGSVVGALAGAALVRSNAPEQSPKMTDAALGERLARLDAGIAAVNGQVDALNKSTSASFTKIVERIEKTQAEPSARLTRISEGVDRLEHKAGTQTNGEVTGSIGNRQTAGLPVVEGWTLREIFNGMALVENRYALFEVEPGSQLPGIGRVESIRRQDGRWVVVTAKGLIVPTRQ